MFKIGDHVVKQQGDYHFNGMVVSAFKKWDMVTNQPTGPTRYVVQNAAGILMIYAERNLKLVGDM